MAFMPRHRETERAGLTLSGGGYRMRPA